MTGRIWQGIGLATLVAVTAIWWAGRLIGSDLFDNGWSFSHWQYLPNWSGYLWLALTAGTTFWVFKRNEALGSFFESRRNALLGLTVLFFLFILLQFDSFVYGGGNLRVGQIAQAPRIILRWFEFGTVAMVAALYEVISLLPVRENTAGGLAWRMVSFGATALTIVGAVRIASELAKDTTRRVLLFVVLVFGPQALMLFGYIGVEPIIVTATVWFAYFALRHDRRYSTGTLAILWGIALGGVFFHYTLVFLIPATVYLSLAGAAKKKWRSYAATASALLVYAGIVFLLYYVAEQSLEFSHNLLFLEGKPPQSDYALFSQRRIGDVLQVLFLVAPVSIVATLVGAVSRNRNKENRAVVAVWLLALSGLTILVTHFPINSIVLDLPRFVAYLTPLSLLSVLVLNNSEGAKAQSPRLLGIAAAASVWILVAYLPTYIRIDLSAEYAEEYLDDHDSFHRTADIAYRDAYFYKGDLDQANFWDGRHVVESPDMLNFRGCNDLAVAGEVDEALTILGRIIARNPYWTEPRELMAALQLDQGRPHLAKPQIDTCLLLAPYRKNCLTSLYAYYRTTGRFADAVDVVERALGIFPGDKDILTDKMIIVLQSGNTGRAGRLADSLLTADSTLPQPYRVKGMIAEYQGRLEDAKNHYTVFVRLAPKDPEALNIMDRINQINVRLREQ